MSATDEIPVKSEIFKDIKYYVSGTIEPEVRIYPIYDNNNTILKLFVLFLDSKIAGKWWCIIDKAYLYEYHAFDVRSRI